VVGDDRDGRGVVKVVVDLVQLPQGLVGVAGAVPGVLVQLVEEEEHDTAQCPVAPAILFNVGVPAASMICASCEKRKRRGGKKKEKEKVESRKDETV